MGKKARKLEMTAVTSEFFPSRTGVYAIPVSRDGDLCSFFMDTYERDHVLIRARWAFDAIKNKRSR